MAETIGKLVASTAATLTIAGALTIQYALAEPAKTDVKPAIKAEKPATEADTPVTSAAEEPKPINAPAVQTEAPATKAAEEPKPINAPAENAPTPTKADPFAVSQNEAADHYDAAKAYLGQGELDLADVELRAAISCVPKTMAAHRDYGLVSLFKGHPGRALAEFLMVIGIGEPIPYTDTQKEAIKNDGLKLHYRRGLALAAESKWKDALTELEWARFYKPNSAKVIRSMAFAYASEGNFDLAEKQYAQSFAMDPADAYSHADFAFLLAAKGSAERAIEQLSEAVKLQPKVAALHVDLGWMAESKGDLGEASTQFAEAIKLTPKQASLWTHLGKLQSRQGQSAEAIDSFKKALALDAGQLDAQEGLNVLQPAVPIK